jgi:flagellar assembly factor FliW
VVKSHELGHEDNKIKDVITFDEGLPGFEHLKSFVLLNPQKDLPFKYLQSTKEPSIALVVVDPYLYIEEYSFNIDEDVIGALEIKEPCDVLVLSVMVIPEDIRKMSINLAAPIIINTKNLKGKQLILQDEKYEIRFPVYEAYKNLICREAKANACSDA